ncbi:MAG TPA: sodium:calcium antiporter [Candidatus Dormibacteraeota bacterium]|nr:sodium:calcium antiporter [Candidatus Dormibacteraeota bacterium]
MDIVLLLGSLAIILVAAELFTNGIEWFGHKLNLAEGAVGSVLAAVATAMPETLIPVIAILGPVLLGGVATEGSQAVGVGAILGAPFMLSTLAMFVTGVAIVLFARRGRRTTAMRINVSVLGRDVAFFLAGYGVAIGTAFLPPEWSWLKWVAAAFLFVLYAVYVRLHFTDTAEEESGHEDLNRLHLMRVPALSGPRMLEIDVLPGPHSVTGGEPRMAIVVAQVVLALGLIIVGAQVFVGAVEHLSTVIGLDTTILALIIAPIATELPEKFNSVLWVRTGKDTLAMGNITGAMVFQSCLPTVLGLLFTSWTFSGESAIYFASAGVAFVATILIFGTMLRRGALSAWTLLLGGPLYALYVYLALFTPLGSGAAALP